MLASLSLPHLVEGRSLSMRHSGESNAFDSVPPCPAFFEQPEWYQCQTLHSWAVSHCLWAIVWIQACWIWWLYVDAVRRAGILFGLTMARFRQCPLFRKYSITMVTMRISSRMLAQECKQICSRRSSTLPACHRFVTCVRMCRRGPFLCTPNGRMGAGASPPLGRVCSFLPDWIHPDQLGAVEKPLWAGPGQQCSDSCVAQYVSTTADQYERPKSLETDKEEEYNTHFLDVAAFEPEVSEDSQWVRIPMMMI